MSRPGQAEMTLPSFPQLSWLDFAWLMNCDQTHIQGCLCCPFFSPYKHTSQAECECETTLNSADGSQLFYQLAWLHRSARLAEHLKDPHCQDVRVAARTAICLLSREKQRKQRHKAAQTRFTPHTLKWVSPVIADNRAPKLQGTCFTNQSEEGFLIKTFTYVSKEIVFILKLLFRSLL